MDAVFGEVFGYLDSPGGELLDAFVTSAEVYATELFALELHELNVSELTLVSFSKGEKDCHAITA